MNLVGETVINQARLKEFGQELRSADRRMGDLYQQIVYDSDIVVRELQDQVMNIRMVPIKGTFFTVAKNCAGLLCELRKKNPTTDLRW